MAPARTAFTDMLRDEPLAETAEQGRQELVVAFTEMQLSDEEMRETPPASVVARMRRSR
jgi:hypothetical protein